MMIKPIRPGKGEVAVIGGGVFGCLAALKLADNGYTVTIYEANKELLCGASLVNQNRLHMGYHYPRSPETAMACATYERGFRRMFPECVVDFEHYYAIAREGKVTGDDFDAHCCAISYDWDRDCFPKDIKYTVKISEFIRVNEGIIDIGRLRYVLAGQIMARENIGVYYNCQVNRIVRHGRQWLINGGCVGYDAVVNATYGSINVVLGMAGFELEEYKYDLCEVIVMTNPFRRRMGIGIMDGPFFGVLPFGTSENCLLYDVEHSVIDSFIGKYYKADNVTAFDAVLSCNQRYLNYIRKAVQYLPEMANAKRLYSMYAVKVTKPDHGHNTDDARPTEIINHGDGFYSIFAGKMSAAIPAADTVTMEVMKWTN